jgi:hypothetical protein
MERDFYYLLPDGINTADNMKVGCDFLSRQTGHSYTSGTFRNLVRKGVIKKLNRITHSIMTKSDANEKTTLPTSQFIDCGR